MDVANLFYFKLILSMIKKSLDVKIAKKKKNGKTAMLYDSC